MGFQHGPLVSVRDMWWRRRRRLRWVLEVLTCGSSPGPVGRSSNQTLCPAARRLCQTRRAPTSRCAGCGLHGAEPVGHAGAGVRGHTVTRSHTAGQPDQPARPRKRPRRASDRERERERERWLDGRGMEASTTAKWGSACGAGRRRVGCGGKQPATQPTAGFLEHVRHAGITGPRG